LEGLKLKSNEREGLRHSRLKAGAPTKSSTIKRGKEIEKEKRKGSEKNRGPRLSSQLSTWCKLLFRNRESSSVARHIKGPTPRGKKRAVGERHGFFDIESLSTGETHASMAPTKGQRPFRQKGKDTLVMH